MQTIPLFFEWQLCKADLNEFAQDSEYFKPMNIRVVVELELLPEYFYNFEVNKYFESFKQWELGFEDKPKVPEFEPVLTPQGANKAREILQEAFYKQHSNAEEVLDDGSDYKDW